MMDAQSDSAEKLKGVRQDNRRDLILDVAAALFCQNGYHGTSMRDIARDVGMLPGSIYYHFPSKEEILLAVYEEGVKRIESLVDQAVGETDDPWSRLDAAARAHLKTLLARGPYAQVVIRIWPQDLEQGQARLIELRNRYEKRFRRVVDDLNLESETDSRYLRLMLLGAMNWVQAWYRETGDQPEFIAEQFVRLLRDGARNNEPGGR